MRRLRHREGEIKQVDRKKRTTKMEKKKLAGVYNSVMRRYLGFKREKSISHTHYSFIGKFTFI